MRCHSAVQIDSNQHWGSLLDMAPSNSWPLSNCALFLSMKIGASYIKIFNLHQTDCLSSHLLIIYGQVSRNQVRARISVLLWGNMIYGFLNVHLAGWCLLIGKTKREALSGSIHPGYKSKGMRVPTDKIPFIPYPRLTYRVPKSSKVIKTLHWGYRGSITRNWNPGKIPGSV